MDQTKHNRTKAARDLGRDMSLDGDLPLWPELFGIDLEAPVPLVPNDDPLADRRTLSAYAVARRLDDLADEFDSLSRRLRGQADAIRNAVMESGLR